MIFRETSSLSAPPKEIAGDRLLDLAAIGLVLVLTAVAFATFRDYGPGWDDLTHAQYGDLLLSLYSSGLKDSRAFSFVNLYMYGGGFDALAALAAKALPFGLFETRRLIGALVGLIGLLTVWRLGRRLGGSLAGLFALALLATCPLYYGHMFINPKDAPFAVWVMLFLLGTSRALDEYPRPSPSTVALIGIGFGLTVGSRIVGVAVGSFAIVPLALIVGSEARAFGLGFAAKRATLFLSMLFPSLLLGYLVMGLVWPWGVAEPLNPIRATEYFSHFFEKPWREMFDGEAVLVPEMPRTYLPLLFALKLPEIMLVLGLAGAFGAFLLSFRRNEPARRRAILLLLAIAATLPIALTIIARPALYNGIRHFLFVAPPLAVLAGWVAALAARALNEKQRWQRLAFACLMLLGLVSPAVEMVRLHPYQYTHFNRFAGGVRGADDRYMIDYWGLAFKQAAQDLRDKLTERLETPVRDRRWRIAVCGPHSAAAVELGPEFLLTWDAKGADFALMLGEFYCAELNAPVLVEIERESVVYARVYDIRGRTISSLFTISPP